MFQARIANKKWHWVTLNPSPFTPLSPLLPLSPSLHFTSLAIKDIKAYSFNLRAKSGIWFVLDIFLSKGSNAILYTIVIWCGTNATAWWRSGEFQIITSATKFIFLHVGVSDPFDLAFGQLVFHTKLYHVNHTIFHFADLRAVGTRKKLLWSRVEPRCYDVFFSGEEEEKYGK